MENLRAKLRLAFRAENVGAGFYSTLSGHCRKQPNLAMKLVEFARHESRHAVMFSALHKKEYGTELGGGKTWFRIGRMLAHLQLFLPLEHKLRLIGKVERKAILQLEHSLTLGTRGPYQEMIEKILPDERKHAEFYATWYS